MEAMINLILQFGDLNKQQIDFLPSKVEMLEFKKDDYLSEAGKVPPLCGVGTGRCVPLLLL